MRFFNRPSKANLQAVGDDRFEELLNSLGVLKEVQNNKKKCKFCKEVVSANSISYIFPESGAIKFVCDKTQCTTQLLDYINEGKIK